jgi:hypothetical protein
MSVFGQIKQAWETLSTDVKASVEHIFNGGFTEADLQKIAIDIAADIQVAQGDIDKAYAIVKAGTPAALANLGNFVNLLASFGVTATAIPALGPELGALSLALNALSAFAAAENAGAPAGDAVLSGLKVINGSVAAVWAVLDKILTQGSSVAATIASNVAAGNAVVVPPAAVLAPVTPA